jgi:flagellar biosynthesis/type III secretory pathway chaperone
MTSMMNLPEISLDDSLKVDELIAVTARLTVLLKEESAHLKAMRIRAVAPLQEEKNRLISWLETQKKIIALNPHMKNDFSPQQQKKMSEVAEEFSRAVEENYHQTSIARAVNQRLVQAVADAVNEQTHVGTYNAYGAARNAMSLGAQGLPFNVNQKA